MKKVVLGVISKQNEQGETAYLLVQAKKDFGEFTGFYYPPGGHVEEGENEEEALAREIQEELGLVVKVLEKQMETGSDIEDQTTHFWTCHIHEGDITIDNTELSDANFFTLEEMRTMNIWPTTRKFFKL